MPKLWQVRPPLGLLREAKERILTSSSGPSYEARIRQEIAEVVRELPGYDLEGGDEGSLIAMQRANDGDYLDRDDVLAVINGGEK